MKIYGIDVSHHQGAIDWAKTASELRRVNGGTSPGFAILRVGYSARHGKGGLYMDGQFLNNLAACEKYGVPVGVYFYCYDTSPAAARITAQQVVKMLSGHKFAYPIYYDVEYEKYNLNCGKAQNTAIIKAALETWKRAAIMPPCTVPAPSSSTKPICRALPTSTSGKLLTPKPTLPRCRTVCGSIPARTRWELQASAIAWTATSATATIPPLWKRTD